MFSPQKKRKLNEAFPEAGQVSPSASGSSWPSPSKFLKSMFSSSPSPHNSKAAPLTNNDENVEPSPKRQRVMDPNALISSTTPRSPGLRKTTTATPSILRTSPSKLRSPGPLRETVGNIVYESEDESDNSKVIIQKKLQFDDDETNDENTSTKPQQSTLKSSLETIFSPVFTLLYPKKSQSENTKNESEDEDEEEILNHCRNTMSSDLFQEALLVSCDSENTVVELDRDPSSACVTEVTAEDSESDLSSDDEDDLDDDEANEVDDDGFDPYYFIKTLPPVPQHFAERPANLPKSKHHHSKPTLVLDLDETLVHCSTEYMAGAHYQFPIDFGGTTYQIWAKVRPHVHTFLSHVVQKYEVVCFTASQKVYADTILDKVDKQKTVEHRLFRDSCVYVNGNFMKDLNILGRDLSKVVIIDNSVTAFGYQLENGVPILSWFEDEKDQELLNLLPLLDRLATAHDVRPVLRKHFKLHRKVARSKPAPLLEPLPVSYAQIRREVRVSDDSSQSDSESDYAGDSDDDVCCN